MRLLYLLVFTCAAAFAQNTAKFPGAVPTKQDLFLANNRAASTLSLAITDSSLTLTVASGSTFTAPGLVTIDNEVISICQVAGNNLTVGYSACPNIDGRGFDGTAAAAHLQSRPVQGRIVAWHRNQDAAEIIAIATKLNKELVSVKDFGAQGDGSTDDTAAFQAAVDSLTGGGKVLVPRTSGYYKLTSTIQIPNHVTIAGEYDVKAPSGGATAMPRVYSAAAAPIFSQKSASAYGIHIEKLYIQGTSVSGAKGIYFSNCASCYIEDNYVLPFGDQAIHWAAGYDGVVRNNVAQGCIVSSGRAAYCGALQVGATDVEISYNNLGSYACTAQNAGNCPGPGTIVGGYCAAAYLTGGKHFVHDNIFSFAEHGLVYAGASSQIVSNHGEYNLGHGFLITGASNQFVGNLAYTNSQATTNTYDGFYTSGGHNVFTANHVETVGGAGLPEMRYGFHDAAADSSAVNWANRYDASNQVLNAATAKYNSAGSTKKLVSLMVELPAGTSEDVPNTLTAPNFLNSTLLSGTNVQHKIKATAAAANSRLWRISTNATGSYSQLFVEACNDAETACGQAIRIDRTGATVNSVDLMGSAATSPQIQIGGGNWLKKVASASGAWDPSSAADNAISVLNTGLSGVANDGTWTCTASHSGITIGNLMLVSAFPIAANTVQVTILNKTGSPVDIPSGTLRVACMQF